MNKAEIIFEVGKKWIKKSSIRNIDRTAYIFISELEEMEEDELADKLYGIYSGEFDWG